MLIDKGFDILLTPRTGDGGKDIIAAYTFEREPIIMMVECKRRPVDLTLGPIELRALVGQFYYEKTENSKINYAMLVTSAGKFGKIKTQPPNKIVSQVKISVGLIAVAQYADFFICFG